MTRSSFRRGALAALACTVVVALFSVNNESYFGAEWLVRDWISARLAAHRPPDPRIVIVAVNEKSVQTLGADFGRAQSYTRELYARAVEELRRAGASLIVFDVQFDQPNIADPEGDRRFGSALAGTPPVILAANTQPKSGARPLPAAFQRFLWSGSGLPASPLCSATTPYSDFQQAAGIGTIRLQSSAYSANVHSYPLFDRVRGGFLPALAVEAFRASRNAPRTTQWRSTLNGGSVTIAGRAVPVDADGDLIIRWHGAKNSRTDISYRVEDFDRLIVASMAREDPAAAATTPEKLAQYERRFAGKTVVVAFTAAGLLDLRSTPLSPTVAGAEIHANALDNLLNGNFDVVVNRWLIFPFIALAVALFGAVLESIRKQVAAGAIALVVIAIALAVIYGSAAAGWILPAVGCIASLGLTYVTITVLNLIGEQQQTAVLKTTFGRYVSPQILQHVLAHPERVELGGERRDLTILFSDIRGFTSISEAAEPEQVVEMLNEYLTRMVEILLAYGGTLDKFIGDAVMGFWNAPAPDPDHPRHAVACAIEMIDETAKLRERWITEGKAAIRIGIGINTGEAVVGNIGAERVFGYTVIGDAVNLASRLESKNKDYGTEIIISEFTLGRIGDAFDTVYLDEVKVKGKEKAVKIYQVRGARQAAVPEPVAEVSSHA